MQSGAHRLFFVLVIFFQQPDFPAQFNIIFPDLFQPGLDLAQSGLLLPIGMQSMPAPYYGPDKQDIHYQQNAKYSLRPHDLPLVLGALSALPGLPEQLMMVEEFPGLFQRGFQR